MNSYVKKIEIFQNGHHLSALMFIPKIDSIPIGQCVFTHGYTSSKTSLLSWSQTLLQSNIPSILFDLPGHLLGNSSDISSLEEFYEVAIQFFHQCTEYMNQEKPKWEHVPWWFGGHSLGAFIALNASRIKKPKIKTVCVGLGLKKDLRKTIAHHHFFKDVIEFRKHLVSETLSPAPFFSWLQKKKENLDISNQNFFFITGKDDIVMTPEDTQNLIEHLKNKNDIKSVFPKHLPHYLPERASSEIKNLILNDSLSNKI